MPRFTFPHPVDHRLHAQYGDEGNGVFLEMWVLNEVTVRYGEDGGSEDACWDPTRPVFWQVIDVLSLMGFCSVVDVQAVLESHEHGAAPPRSLRRVAELIENLRGLCE